MSFEVDDDAYGTGEFEAGTLKFSEWLKLLDNEVVRITSLKGGVGLGHEDFADWHYAAAFEDEVEPVEAARDMLAEDTSGAGFLKLAGIEGGL